MLNSSLSLCKETGAGQWSFLGFGSEKKWYSISEDSPQGEWDGIAEQMMLTFAESKHPVFRSTSPLSRGVLKSKENCRYTIAPTRERLKLFFAQLFLLISSVFTEQSQTCVKNVNPAMIEPGDLLWKDNPTHCSCQVWWRQTYHWLMILHTKKIYCEDIESELESHHNKTERANSVLMQDSWQQLKSDSISSRKTLKNSHNSQIQWPVVRTPCQETKIHLNQKVGFEGTPGLGPYWKSQPATYKVNMEWKSELSPWTRTILTRGSEFLMTWISWSQTWTTRTKTTTTRKLQKCISKTMH